MCHIDVGYEECQALRDTTRELVDREEEAAELEERADELLDAAREGDDDATEARAAVMDELETVREGVEALEEEANVCDRFHRNLTADTDDFYAWLHGDVRTPDEVYDYAEAAGFCGYELLKRGMDRVDLVICNYNHLLDPAIREQFFRWIGRDPEDVVAVFDEAHNVEEAARDHATRTMTERTLTAAVEEADEADDYRADAAVRVLAAFRDGLVRAYDEALGFGDREAIDDDWTDVVIDEEEGRDDLTVAFLDAYEGPGFRRDLESALKLGRALDSTYAERYKNGETATREECQLLQAARFAEEWIEEGAAASTYPVASVRRDDAGVYGRAELYTCIPRRVTEPLFADLHASVLMSATLRPFDVLRDTLGVGVAGALGDATGTDGGNGSGEEGPLTMAYGAQFPEERRRTYAVDVPALFASQRDDPGIQETVTAVLTDAVEFTPGNTLAFFPSYAEAERYYHRLETDATPYLDRPGVRAQELREEFVADEDAVLFTSLWGTLGEGVSYDGDDARTVAVVGVPYPRLDDRSEAVQRAYEAAFDDEDAGWTYAVEVPTVRKTRQALGRVVRSPTDFGARLLIDERYAASAAAELGDYSVHGSFPPEERAETIDVGPGKLRYALRNFYGDLGAYDGRPPDPGG
jgi:DNA excision repair protein ERCC-2